MYPLSRNLLYHFTCVVPLFLYILCYGRPLFPQSAPIFPCIHFLIKFTTSHPFLCWKQSQTVHTVLYNGWKGSVYENIAVTGRNPALPGRVAIGAHFVFDSSIANMIGNLKFGNFDILHWIRLRVLRLLLSSQAII